MVIASWATEVTVPSSGLNVDDNNTYCHYPEKETVLSIEILSYLISDF